MRSSKWQDDPTTDNDEVEEATQYLYTSCVSEFVKILNSLKEKVNATKKLPEILQDFELQTMLHKEGLNIRLLGLIFNQLTDDDLKVFILTEMVTVLIVIHLHFVRLAEH